VKNLTAHETIAMRELLDASDLFAQERKVNLSFACQSESATPTIEGITKIMHKAGECKASFRLINALNAIKPRTMGRPSVGSEMLPALTVPEDLRSALEAKASALGISVPDARREAYRLFTK
jgi:hypothetical protein